MSKRLAIYYQDRRENSRDPGQNFIRGPYDVIISNNKTKNRHAQCVHASTFFVARCMTVPSV